jgi:hypothetical protein
MSSHGISGGSQPALRPGGQNLGGKISAFGRFGVGPLALAGEEGFEPIDVGLQRCDVAFETGR